MIQKILFDYFEGRATSMQRKLIEDWLKEDLENEVVYYQYLDEWENLNPQYISDVENGWQQFECVLNTPIIHDEQLEEENEEDIKSPARMRNWRRIWFIAASVSILIAGSLFFFQKPILYRTYETGNAETKNIKLEDETLVTLNANSTLSVPRWGYPCLRQYYSQWYH